MTASTNFKVKRTIYSANEWTNWLKCRIKNRYRHAISMWQSAIKRFFSFWRHNCRHHNLSAHTILTCPFLCRKSTPNIQPSMQTIVSRFGYTKYDSNALRILDNNYSDCDEWKYCERQTLTQPHHWYMPLAGWQHCFVSHTVVKLAAIHVVEISVQPMWTRCMGARFICYVN